MRRLALLLAASVLGTGCIVTTDDDFTHTGSVIINWDFARFAPAQTATTTHTDPGWIYYDEAGVGTPNSACLESQVDTVGIIPPGGAEIRVACVYTNGVQGITIDNVPEGNRTFRFIGYRGNLVVYDSEETLAVSSVDTYQYTVHITGVPAVLQLYGDLTFGSGQAAYLDCAEAGSPQIGWEIVDPVFGLQVEAGRVLCTNPLPVPVYNDWLDLDTDYIVRLVGFQGATSTVTFDSCDKSLDHLGTQANGNAVTYNLQNAPIPACE